MVRRWDHKGPLSISIEFASYSRNNVILIELEHGSFGGVGVFLWCVFFSVNTLVKTLCYIFIHPISGSKLQRFIPSKNLKIMLDI